MTSSKLTTSLRKHLMLLLRLASSFLILAVLIWVVRGSDVLNRLQAMQPHYLAAALVALAGVIVCSGLRWQVLLQGHRIWCNPWIVLNLSWVSMFFTLFLPGSVGGDVVRSYYVARQHGRLAAIILSTFQERLTGLAGLLVMGCTAILLLHEQLGAQLSGTLGLLHVAALGAVAIVLYPTPLLALSKWTWLFLKQWRLTNKFVEHARFTQVQQFLSSASQPLNLGLGQMMTLGFVAWLSALLGVSTYWMLALALGVKVSWLALCIVTSVVTLARTMPISVNGIGVGEGAFVVMLKPFGVASADALALSLSGLAIHTVAGLIGGVIYVVFLQRGVQFKLPQEAE